MNKYQRQRSKEIKMLVRFDAFGRLTFAKARRMRKQMKLDSGIVTAIAEVLRGEGRDIVPPIVVVTRREVHHECPNPCYRCFLHC